MSDFRRLFFALWPTPNVRRALDGIARRFRPDKSRAIVSTNLHATLVFLGQQPVEFLPPIMEVAADISARPFMLTLESLQYWRRPQVLCLCPHHIPDELIRLHDDLSKALGYAGMQTEDRKYRPHVTLARKVRRYDGPGDLPQALCWPVSGFSLIESVSLERGVAYQPLGHWPF
jgi:2'-5' RNA ligase